MKQSIITFLLMAFATVVFAQDKTAKLTLKVDNPSVTVSPYLYGLMTEEINYSYEGGLYAQLIRNPSMKDVAPMPRRQGGGPPPEFHPNRRPVIPGWSLSDTLAANLTIDRNEGLNTANTISLCLDIPDGGKDIGLLNEGFWGFPVRPNTVYKGSLYVKTAASGSPTLTISLESLDGKTVYAKTTVTGINGQWKKYPYSFSTGSGDKPTKEARLRITASDKGKYWFTRVTLFPPTYNNRPNGLRPELMTMMRNMNPKFLRFPGGNYLEGNTFSARFNWKETIGDPDTRPGHDSPWGYRSTDGLGLLEFLEWAEDIGAEPLVGVFAGYVLNRDYLTGEFLEPFIKDALDEIEYITGATGTKWGAQRAKDGHPEPFKLTYVEIGNEDWFDRSGSYTQRYKQFYDAIKAKYPALEIISTIGGNTNMGSTMNVPGVKIDIIDEHYYRGAGDMYKNAFQYDSYDRNGPKIFCGEWATREGSPTPYMNAALGDGAWMTCMERNSDICIMSCYAPMFVNVSPGAMQWESDLIGYDALTVYGSPSYYAQVIFAGYLGDKVVPVEAENIPTFELPLTRMDSIRNASPSVVQKLYYVATKDTKTGNVFLKVVNVEKEPQKVAISIEGKSKVQPKALKVELKGDSPTATNTIDHPENIIPVKSETKVGKNFAYTFPPYSITMLQINTHK
jgi:alpha-N-arabinofuranosidase